MSVFSKARASARALLTAVPLGIGAGAMVGAALGGAFLAGGLAQDAVVHARATRVAETMPSQLSDQALRAMVHDDASMLSLALRYDPFADSSNALLSTQELTLARSLEAKLAAGDPLYPVTERAVNNPAAQPWNANPLDATRQLDCLAEAVYYEARGETPAGQAAVAQVVLNRVRHPSFPRSICAVVFQGAQTGRCQFSFACDGAMSRPRNQGAWNRSVRVAERALGGYVLPEVGNATHFHTVSIRPNWRNMVRVATIGSHVFLRFGGRNGAPGAFTDTPAEEPDTIIEAAVVETEVVDLDISAEPALVDIAAPKAPATAAPVEPEVAPAQPARRPATRPAPERAPNA